MPNPHQPGEAGENEADTPTAAFRPVTSIPTTLADMPLPAAIIDETLVVRGANDPFQRYMGTGQPDARLGFICSHQQAALARAVAAALRGETSHVSNVVLTMPPGNIITADALLFRHSAGHPARTAVMLFSRLVEAEAQQRLAEQTAWLVGSAKLVDLLAHKFANCLATIAGFSQLMTDERLPVAAVDELERIAQAAAQGQAMLSKLSQHAREQHPQAAETCVCGLAARAIAAVAWRLAAARIHLDVDIPAATPAVRVVQQEILFALMNIIDNSLRAMPGGGRLTLRAKRLTLPQETVELEIADTGSGIEPSILATVLEPFVTTRPDEAGGLGLALSRSILAAHGGSLRVKHSSPAGTSVVMVLPAATGPHDDTATRPPSRHKRVLVIDDDEGCRNLMTLALSREGHIADAVADGQAALKLLEGQGYDVIVADFHMPYLGGKAFYETVRARWPHLVERVVFITGDTVDKSIQSFLQTLPNPHLAKPFDLNDFVRAVEKL